MLHPIRQALLITVILCQSLSAAEVAPDDQTLIAMANRRLVAGDFGMTMEQMFRRAAARSTELPRLGGMPTVMKRGAPAAGGIHPVRFRVLIKSEGGDDVMIIDARISRDEFGDLSMEWHYNVDQTLVERERMGGARLAEKEDLDRRFPDRVTEVRAATSLKAGVFPAQVQFQGGGYEDFNKNGIGDFSRDFPVLSGERNFIPPGGKDPLTVNLLPKGFAENLEKEGFTLLMLADNEMGFWCFMVLPSRAKTVAIDASGTVRVFPGVVLPPDIAEAKKTMPTGAVDKRAP